jgi:hypothetical protein
MEEEKKKRTSHFFFLSFFLHASIPCNYNQQTTTVAYMQTKREQRERVDYNEKSFNRYMNIRI